MDYPPLICEERKAQELTSQQSRSLYAVCQHLLDGRAARGKRYDLAALVTLLILAKLAGMKSLLGASEWIADQQERLCERLHLSWKRMPCAITYKYALARLDSAQVNEELAAWLVRSVRDLPMWAGTEPSAHAAREAKRPSG